METFIINYHSGFCKEVNVNNLEEAKDIAKEGMEYTKENVTIETTTGEILTSSKWSKGEPQKEDAILKTVSVGFYHMWIDE